MLKKTIVIGIVCLFLLMSTPIVMSDDAPSEPLNNGGLADKIKVEWHGPFLIELIRWNWKEPGLWNFITNENDVTVECQVYFNGMDRSGNILKYDDPQWGEIKFEDSDSLSMHPDYMGTMPYWTIQMFRKAGLTFGFFNINVEITVPEDGSSKILRYTGVVLGIWSIIFNPNGKIVE